MILSLLAALCLGLLSLISADARAQSAEPQRLTVRLDWLPHSTHSIFHLPVLNGAFAKRGLQVTVEDGNGSGITVQAVGASKFDVGFAHLSTMAVARDKGVPIRTIAGIYRKNYTGVLVPIGSGLKTPKDLEGKRVLWTPGSAEAPFVDAFFRGGGARRENVNLVAINAAAKVTAYANGTGDAVITSVPPFLGILRPTRPSEGILFNDFGLPLPGVGLVTSEQTLKTKQQALRTFVEVVLQAWGYILDGHEGEGMDAVVKQRPNTISRAELLENFADNMPYIHTAATKDKPLGWQSEEDWAAALKVMAEAGVVSKDAKPGDFYTNDLLPRTAIAPRSR
jgi:NitT/TauT family transport system substrate-binding protein